LFYDIINIHKHAYAVERVFLAIFIFSCSAVTLM